MKKMIIIGVVIVVLLVGAVAAYFLLIKSDDKEPEVNYLEYDFDGGEYYTNIEDEGKILKFTIVVEYTGEETITKIKKHKTGIVSEFTSIFKSFSNEDLKKPTGEKRVGAKIRQMIIEKLDSDEETITNVYFPTFIIQ